MPRSGPVVPHACSLAALSRTYIMALDRPKKKPGRGRVRAEGKGGGPQAVLRCWLRKRPAKGIALRPILIEGSGGCCAASQASEAARVR
jgi:hypothetical protein